MRETMNLLERGIEKGSAVAKRIEIGTVDAIAEEMIHDGEEVQIEDTVRRRVRRLPDVDRHLVQRHGTATISRKMDSAHSLISNFQFKTTTTSPPSRPSCHNPCRCK